jgi:DNA polymerase-3 subunit alpha
MTSIPEVIKLAGELRGRIRGGGMHAAGVVLSKEPLANYMPIETATNTQDKNAPRIPLIAMDMNQVADIGGIKMDALGLKTLSVMEDAVKLIEERYDRKVISLPWTGRPRRYLLCYPRATRRAFSSVRPRRTRTC